MYVSKMSLDIDGNPQLPIIIKKRHTCCTYGNRTKFYKPDHIRIMNKRGRINVYLTKIPDKSIRYVRDLWTTLVNMRWRWLMVTVGLVNVFAYLLFAEMFLFDAWFSGDFDNHLQHNHKTCINGVNNFTSFFMLGIETITTTGYGYFHPTEYCRLVFVILTFSTLVTILIDGAFISVVYVKISRPTSKTSQSLFSKKAVISMRNGKLCLIFRINDRMGKHWINSQIKLFVIKKYHISHEGEFLPNYITELPLIPYGMLLWPVEIVHEINENSYLWDISPKVLMNMKFELLVMLTGNSVLTGQSSKSQTSYMSNEILWGYIFTSCLDYNHNIDLSTSSPSGYMVNKKVFNETIALDTPLCSAHHLYNIEKEITEKRSSILNT